MKRSNKYKPNEVPLNKRVTYVLLAMLLLFYGTLAVIREDFPVPSRMGGVHLHGISVWIMYCAILCAVFNFLSVVVDHYDKRNNEITYQIFFLTTLYLGLFFLFMAFFWPILVGAVSAVGKMFG